MDLSFLLCLIVLLPGAVFAVLGLSWLLGWEPVERTIARLTASCYSLATLALILLFGGMATTGQNRVVAQLGDWFRVGHHSFPLTLVADRLSVPFIGLCVVLVGVVGVFSVRYIHREAGFLRFFLLLHLFGFGILTFFTAGSFDLMVVGWELVGLTSVLLIAFFQHRNEPVQNALRVFATYRMCDVGLLTAVVLMHHYVGTAAFSTLFPNDWPSLEGPLHGTEATSVALLLLIAAMGKAAQVPFSGWLPRAMEGPTPSSAIFYGALSVHAGAYLLLRAQPILARSPWISAITVMVGLLTAIHGTMAGRVSTDAKTSLTHASVTQLGLIFAEIGLGWSWLAMVHICSHAAIRTLEYLRAPSALHDFHHVYSAQGGQLAKTGAHFEMLLPAAFRNWLYRLALDRGHLDTLLDRCMVGPLLRLAGGLHRFEQRWIERVFGPAAARTPKVVAKAGLTPQQKPESSRA